MTWYPPSVTQRVTLPPAPRPKLSPGRAVAVWLALAALAWVIVAAVVAALALFGLDPGPVPGPDAAGPP